MKAELCVPVAKLRRAKVTDMHNKLVGWQVGVFELAWNCEFLWWSFCLEGEAVVERSVTIHLAVHRVHADSQIHSCVCPSVYVFIFISLWLIINTTKRSWFIIYIIFFLISALI